MAWQSVLTTEKSIKLSLYLAVLNHALILSFQVLWFIRKPLAQIHTENDTKVVHMQSLTQPQEEECCAADNKQAQVADRVKSMSPDCCARKSHINTQAEASQPFFTFVAQLLILKIPILIHTVPMCNLISKWQPFRKLN